MHDLVGYLGFTYKGLFEVERVRGERKRTMGGCGCGCGDSGSVPLRFGEVRGLFEKGGVFDGVFGFRNGDGCAGGSID